MKTIGNIRRQNSKDGFTMTEVIVASLVFTLAAAGIFATTSALNQPNVETNEEATAAFLAKQILESRRTAVRADTWDTGDLSIGTHSGVTPINGKNYPWTYNVTVDPDGTGARFLTLSVGIPSS